MSENLYAVESGTLVYDGDTRYSRENNTMVYVNTFITPPVGVNVPQGPVFTVVGTNNLAIWSCSDGYVFPTALKESVPQAYSSTTIKCVREVCRLGEAYASLLDSGSWSIKSYYRAVDKGYTCKGINEIDRVVTFCVPKSEQDYWKLF
ncbi:hypothetical protein QIW49_00800 [Francisellaceae bacterium CB300]